MTLRAELKNAYVYVHIEADTGNPFYVGMGASRKRPWDLSDRSKAHHKKVSEHGIRVEIVIDDLDKDLAAWWEIRWIKALRDAGYDLVNRTTGGNRGFNYSEEAVEKIRQANVGKRYSVEVNKRKGRSGPKVFTEQGYLNLKAPKTNLTRQKMSAKALVVQASEDQRKKNSEGRRKAWSKLSFGERQAINKATWQNSMTPEKIAARSKKSAETRRRNQLLKEGVE